MSDFKKIERETSDFKNKIVQETRNSRGMSGKQQKKNVECLVRLLWRAAAAGLKPLRLRRAQFPGTGEGGDWWS